MSSKAKANKDCLQKGDMEAETTFTYVHIFTYIKKHRPFLFQLENVRQIMSKGDFDKSDAEWIVSEFRAIGYWVSWFLFDSMDFGSIAARTRVYFLGFNCENFNARPDFMYAKPSPMDWCMNFYNTFSTDSLPLERFLYFDLADALDKMSEHCVMDPPRGDNTKDAKWRDEHCTEFRELGLPWPCDLPEASFTLDSMRPFTFEVQTEEGVNKVSFDFWRGGLGDRQSEMILYFMVKHPMDKCMQPQFLDANFTLGRLLSYEGVLGPWKSCMPCMTGQSRHVMRYYDACSNIFIVRPLLGIEAFATIGWDYEMWWPHSSDRFTDALLLNMCGNAYSAFAVLPMLMTGIAGCGILSQHGTARFLEDGVTDTTGDKEEDGDSDSGISISS